jgi:uncharacterized protein YbaR (Trm112 family)
MSTRSVILDLLVCPNCLGELLHREGDVEELWCRFDHLAFPIREGIPVMLIDEARQLSLEEQDVCKKS